MKTKQVQTISGCYKANKKDARNKRRDAPGGENFVKVGEALAALNLADDLDVPASLAQRRADLMHMLGFAHKRRKDKVDALRGNKGEVPLVLRRDGWQGKGDAREVDTLAVVEHGRVEHAADKPGVAAGLDLER